MSDLLLTGMDEIRGAFVTLIYMRHRVDLGDDYYKDEINQLIRNVNGWSHGYGGLDCEDGRAELLWHELRNLVIYAPRVIPQVKEAVKEGKVYEF